MFCSCLAATRQIAEMATEEKVLCFERKLFEELGVFQGLSPDVGKIPARS